MGKRNRDKLLEQSMYDMLLKMNEWLIKNTASICIMECFMQSLEAQERCIQDCEKCLQSWMNEDPY